MARCPDPGFPLGATAGPVEVPDNPRRSGSPRQAGFEDNAHVLFPAYDGPPNPLHDPGDEFAAPEELEWDNVLVRCSFTGNCERAARVDAPEKSIVLGDTAPAHVPLF